MATVFKKFHSPILGEVFRKEEFMKKKILTLEDLVSFCIEQNFQTFSAKDYGYQICVEVPAKFEKVDISDDLMLFANVLAFHTGRNLNRSCVPDSAAKKAIQSLAYKPVLANFCEIDGVRDFTSHDFEINNDGNITYYEKQVGCFTAKQATLKQDDKDEDRQNVFAEVAIPRQYTDAAEIIERKGGTDVSVELGINELSWDAKENVLMLNDIDVMGLTLLGKNPETGEDVKPGMAGAHIQLEDFSVENNSVIFNKTELVEEITQAVISKLDNHINNQRKEEPALDFEEKNETTVEEMEVKSTEEAVTEEMSEEDTEETPEVIEEFDDSAEGAEGADDANGANDANDSDNDSDDSDDNSEGENEVDNTDDGILNNGQQQNRIDYSVNIDGVVKTYSVSLVEKLNALYELVNATYGEVDNTWYDVDAYDEDKVVIMHDYWGDKHYKQSYSVKKDVYSLKGDRVRVYCTYLTEDEQAQLDNMRSNYAEITSKLEKYEEEPNKMSLLNSSDYLSIADQNDFAELKKIENHFDLTMDELKNKADGILLQYAKAGKLNFASNEEVHNEPKKDFFAFAKINQDTSFLDGLLKKR